MIAGAALACLVATGQAARIRPGEPAPRIPSEGGVPPAKRALIVFPACEPVSSCEAAIRDLRGVREELTKAGFDLTAVLPVGEADWPRRSSPATIRLVFDPGNRVRELYGAGSGGLAVLLEDGIVRRVVRIPARPGAALVESAAQWEQGKAIYNAQCARCHGEDGKDISYPEIKSLAGIGSRISEHEILERTARTGAVDLTPLPEAARTALAVYVAGL